MGLLDGIIGSVSSISASAVAVDGTLRTQLGSAYSQISAMLQGVGTDGLMRKADMQNLVNMLQDLPQQGARSSASSTAKQAKIIMMVVQINALKVQLQKLEETLGELQRDATAPNFGDLQAVLRDVTFIPSGNAEDARAAQQLMAQQTQMFQMITGMLKMQSDMTKDAIRNLK